ncbi:acetylornithine deacetylase [Pandoraea pulmonicola]|uniref:Acetylornithine deacetylase n=1 Tax=Pandoraea pulmonicola TaxID=93221 RepID=A0AAJ4ZGS1_PANPU|nr:acetylornithine deacetylase [Pandoraea pulmonicola]AJC22753.1 acetylornithine deacetylase (ArgE) [Pandoraea pulmonicola]SUA92985.1 Acetylornithine deacetylase [Pandoraea pulmonicola]
MHAHPNTDTQPSPTAGDDDRASAPSSEAIDWISRLIAIDTTSRRSNLGLIELLRDNLRAQGADAWLDYDATGAKANLFATLPARDGGTQGGIVLSGHTDVVPVDGQPWKSAPFVPEIRDDRLYGRGACDMKGFIGTVMSQVPAWLAAPPMAPVHLAFSYDEEIGCLGISPMLAAMARRNIRPQGCVVGEPTRMQAIIAHKGINIYRCSVQGHAAHSSLTPRGVNAIEYAARVICRIREIADAFASQGPYDEGFDVPFSTAQTGTITGGIALNTIPAACEFVFEYRNLPGVSADAIFAQIEAFASQTLIPEMQRVHPGATIHFAKIAAPPSMQASESEDLVRLVRALTPDAALRKVSYGTEAGFFQRAGIPTVVCGPGSIEQAHQPDEFVALTEIARCERFLSKLVRHQLLYKT